MGDPWARPNFIKILKKNLRDFCPMRPSRSPACQTNRRGSGQTETDGASARTAMRPRLRTNRLSKMNHKTSENNPEIAFFIVEGSYRLATISSNDYGFQLSARLALTYLDKAVGMLTAKATFDRAMLAEIGTLKREAARLADEYGQLEKFCVDCQRFNQIKTQGVVEWISKWAVRAISRGYLVDISHRLAYKIRIFHAMACSILIE
jgi:hypothetical protein